MDELVAGFTSTCHPEMGTFWCKHSDYSNEWMLEGDKYDNRITK